MSDPVGSPDIILVLPAGHEIPAPVPAPGYSVRSIPPSLDRWWIDIHRKAIPSFGEADLKVWLERYRNLALPEGILVVTENASGGPVATAGSIASSKNGMFPDGGQLAWVATVPEHRKRGLASWLSALATSRLQREGFRRIFLCTGDDLKPAIRIYLQLGYLPCIYASDQLFRWERICSQINVSYEPDRWPTPEEYLCQT